MSQELPDRREATDLTAGMVVGDYRVEAKLGDGGMSSVYAAVHPVIGKKAAIKVIDPALSTNASAVERFIQEAKAVNKIGHPNIVDIFATGTLPDGRPYLVMEWLHGESLGSRLERGAVPFHQALEIMVQLSHALGAAHEQGIIHRDLKPDNVFLAEVSGGLLHVKLLDFGVAKLSRTPTGAKTREGFTVGTPGYASPEQGRGLEVSAESDVYALGSLAWDLFVGCPPFTAENPMDLMVQHLNEIPPIPSSVRATLPPVLDTLMERMLAKDPVDRPSLAEVAAVVEQLKATPFVEPIPERRRLRVGIAAGAGGVALAVLVGWLLSRGDDEKKVDTPPVVVATPAPAGEAAAAPAPEPARPGTIVLQVDAPDAKVEVDGRPVDASRPIPVDKPGFHMVTVTAPGRKPYETEVDVTLGKTVELHVQLVPLPAAPRAKRPKPPRSDTYTLDPFGGGER